MPDPLLIAIIIVTLIVAAPIAVSIRDGVYEASADRMFDAEELLVRHAEGTSAIDLIEVLDEVDEGMRGYVLVGVAPFVQYHKSDSVPWRYVEETLRYGVALGYRLAGVRGSGVSRQVSIILDSEDVAALWPHHMDDDADRRRRRMDGYRSLLERFVSAHPEHGDVQVADAFITSGAKAYLGE